MEKEYVNLEDLIRPCFANVAWTHKIQEKQAEIHDRKYAVLSMINIFAASITSAGVLSAFFIDNIYIKVISTLVSFVTAFITALLKAFDFQSMAKSNKATATKLVILRDQLLILLYKVRHATQPVAELFEEFNDICEKIHVVYQEAPQTTDNAVDKAAIALKKKRDNTYTDEDIDMLLPESLRRGTSGE